jgi:NADPH:quinone reductase-like Zn-dependent oxidoreductase
MTFLHLSGGTGTTIIKSSHQIITHHQSGGGRHGYITAVWRIPFLASHYEFATTMADQQKVYRVTARTSFDDVKSFNEDIPVAGPHEVLLEIKAVSLNYRDLAIANGQYPFPVEPNVIPVSDCSAIVAKVGPLVNEFSVGDKVVVTFDGSNLYGQQKDWKSGHGGPVDGFLRQYAAVQASYVVKVPPTDLSFPELAALVCTGTTSWNALFGVQPTKPGDVVLVQGKLDSPFLVD